MKEFSTNSPSWEQRLVDQDLGLPGNVWVFLSGTALSGGSGVGEHWEYGGNFGSVADNWYPPFWVFLM